jgi:hypothetical protein
MSKKKIKLSNDINFSNLWSGLLDWKCYNWKKIQNSIPNKLNIEGWNQKKKLITQNDLKIIIKRMRVKIEIKNKLEGKQKFSIRELNWYEK